MSEAITAEKYHADALTTGPTLSRTIAHLLCTSSPRHAWTHHPRLNPDYQPAEAERFDIGTVAHALLLAGSIDGLDVIDAPDWRTAAAKDARDASRAADRIPLLAKYHQAVVAMVDAAEAQLAAHQADPAPFTDGKAEQTLVWDEPGGVTCRARLDWLRDDHQAIDDYKTTSRTANPEQWARSMFGSGYDLQAAFYLRGLTAATGAEDVAFRFVVQETFPPYALSVIAPGEDVLTIARKKAEYAIDLWRRCLKADAWPAYTTDVCYAGLPAFEEARWLERELQEQAA